MRPGAEGRFGSFAGGVGAHQAGTVCKNVYLFAGSDQLFDLSNGKGNLGVGEHLAHFKRGLGLISVDPCAVAFLRVHKPVGTNPLRIISIDHLVHV